MGESRFGSLEGSSAPGWRSWALLATALALLAPVVGCAAPTKDATPNGGKVVTAAGRLQPLGPHISTCVNGEHAWTWSTASRTVSYWGADGVVVSNWTPPSPVRTLYVTDDCKVAWGIDDERRVTRFESSRSNVVWNMAPEIALPGEPDTLLLREDGTAAWSVSDNTPWSPVQLSLRGQSIIVTPSSRPDERYQHMDRARTDGGSALWLIPDGNRTGLDHVDATGVLKPSAALPTVNLCNVFATNLARLNWAIPCRTDVNDKPIRQGLYILGPNGIPFNGGDPILESVSFGNGDGNLFATSWSPYVWAWAAESNDLFAFRSISSGATPVVTALNDGKPVDVRASSVHPVDTIVASPGNVVLATPKNEAWTWTHVRILTVEDSGAIRVTDTLDRRFAPDGVVKVGASTTRPNIFWFKTPDLRWFEMPVDRSGHITEAAPIPIAGLDVVSIADAVARSKGTYWVTGTLGQGLLLDHPIVAIASVAWGAGTLTTDGDSAQQVQAVPEEISYVQTKLDWAGRGLAARPGLLTVELFPTDKPGALAVAVGHAVYESRQNTAQISLSVLRDFQIGKAYDVSLKYSDDDHTQVSATWRGVLFSAPWWRRLLQNAYFAAFLWILGPIVLASVLFQSSRTIRRYAPIIFPGSEVALSKIAPVSAHLSIGPLAVAAASLLVAAVCTGLIAPPLFRVLATMQPFALAAPIALRWRFMRRRVFGKYARELEKLISALREDANGEIYAPCPLYELGRLRNDGATQRRPWRVGKLVSVLVPHTGEAATNVILSAPGGRGKSAALRAICSELLSKWHQDPLRPLPVLCRGVAPTIEARVANAFGAEVVSTEYLTAQIAAGDLVLLIDGFSESHIEPSTIDEHLRTKGSPLCVAIRPSEELVRTFKLATDRLLVVEPATLDDRSLLDFLGVYAASDSEQVPHRKQVGLPVAIETIRQRVTPFRATDGSYLPLLVRLAMLVDPSATETICALYDATVARLLAPSSSDHDAQQALAKRARELALQTYWKDRIRVFPAQRVEAAENEAVLKLLECGLLVGTRVGPLFGSNADLRQVRFFHDSMQSYLAAKALALEGDRGVLHVAATTSEFRGAQAELLGARGPEIFHMCVLTFDEREPLESWFEQQLRDWVQRAETMWEEHGEVPIELAMLRTAIPPEIWHAVTAQFQGAPSAPLFLKRVLEHRPAPGARSTPRRDYLACVYAALAPCFSLDREELSSVSSPARERAHGRPVP